jgi:hypothetical protein
MSDSNTDIYNVSFSSENLKKLEIYSYLPL